MTARARTILIALLGCAVALQLGPLLWTAQPHNLSSSHEVNWHTGNPNTWAVPAESQQPADSLPFEIDPDPLEPCLVAAMADVALASAACTPAYSDSHPDRPRSPAGSLLAQHCLLTV